VAKAKSQVEAEVAQVKAETAKMVALIERETENVKALNKTEVEQLQAKYGAEIAELDADRKLELGKAEAEATKMKETAKGSLFKMKMDVFRSDGDAYLRYTLAQELNPKMQLRLYHSGPGTLWTNMGNKNMSFMLPLPSAESEKTSDKKDK